MGLVLFLFAGLIKEWQSNPLPRYAPIRRPTRPQFELHPCSPVTTVAAGSALRVFFAPICVFLRLSASYARTSCTVTGIDRTQIDAGYARRFDDSTGQQMQPGCISISRRSSRRFGYCQSRQVGLAVVAAVSIARRLTRPSLNCTHGAAAISSLCLKRVTIHARDAVSSVLPRMVLAIIRGIRQIRGRF